ncbi:MAG: hypothetical protein ABH869_07715 [Candidatus Omnitrophota bacterium]
MNIKFLRNIKGTTLVETMFVVIIYAMIIVAILSIWTYTSRSWNTENERTCLRIDLLKALETLKEDLRVSSLTYMSFYPEGGEPYTAFSLPVPKIDASGFLVLNANDEIVWDKTVVYHIYSETDETQTLRRTVLSPRNNALSDLQRKQQLECIVAGGTGGGTAVTDEEFLKNLEVFDISSLSSIIDFYYNAESPVKAGKIMFGRVKLDPGDHIIRFEVTGKNTDSLGYDLGIDSISIEPSGSTREMEYYNSGFAPSGILSLSGGSVQRINDPLWGNNNYLKFTASAIGSYLEITDYYDLWRESSFDNAILNNSETTGEEVCVEIDFPEGDREERITWYAFSEAEDDVMEGNNGAILGGIIPPVTIRTVITRDNIDVEGDMVSVKILASDNNDLVIDRAYITKRDGISGANGLANQDPGVLSVEEYHRHQQLFFEDGDGEIKEGVTVPAGQEVWCEWTAFPLRIDSDYFVTIYLSDAVSLEGKYWSGTEGEERSYYVAGADNTIAGTPDWSGKGPVALKDIYLVGKIDLKSGKGTVESQIFDSTLSAPSYDKIKWSENKPAGTNITLKARSSGNEYMQDAADWDSITGSAVNPHTISIGNGRYVQFFAELSANLFWINSSGTGQLSYEAYIRDQITRPVYEFPQNSGEFLVTSYFSPSIDDVEINWPGQSRICAITGYIAKKKDYGQAKITVDGSELIQTLNIHVKVSKEISGMMVEEENYVEIEPKNTGK